MRRNWICILALAMAMTLLSANITPAKKSRSNRASPGRQVKRDARRGRVSKASSRRERRGRRALAVRGKRGRTPARSRARSRSYEPQVVIAPSAPRPAPGIPPERVTEIQNALIKAGFMDGPATGMYDDATIDAMKDYQARNGMSQTGLPSAPLLKRLGVPKRSNDGYAVPVTRVSETEKKRPHNQEPKL
jgi:hypothetical protein